MTLDRIVAPKATTRETQEPSRTRARMSRPNLGSTPSGWSQLIPPKSPLGREVLASIRSWLKVLGSSPSIDCSGRERAAIRISRTTMRPPATATLSRLKRVQAIWPSERPSIFLASTPSSTASGCASACDPVVSMGAVIVPRACPCRWLPTVPDGRPDLRCGPSPLLFSLSLCVTAWYEGRRGIELRRMNSAFVRSPHRSGGVFNGRAIRHQTRRRMYAQP